MVYINKITSDLTETLTPGVALDSTGELHVVPNQVSAKKDQICVPFTISETGETVIKVTPFSEAPFWWPFPSEPVSANFRFIYNNIEYTLKEQKQSSNPDGKLIGEKNGNMYMGDDYYGFKGSDNSILYIKPNYSWIGNLDDTYFYETNGLVPGIISVYSNSECTDLVSDNIELLY